MSETPETPAEQEAVADEAAASLPVDEFGRPYLPTSQAHQEALQQGYFGNDGKDLGAAVRPEDVHSFDEAAGRVDAPAHSEPAVIEVPNPDQGGYTALGAPNTPAPVEGGDATAADNPSLNVTTPVEDGAPADVTEAPAETTPEGSV